PVSGSVAVTVPTAVPLALFSASDNGPAAFTTGASLTGVPVMALLPVTGAAMPSLTLVAIVKLPLKLAAGVKVRPARRMFTFAIAPLAVQTPVAALYVEVTAPEVAVFKLPAVGSDSVN